MVRHDNIKPNQLQHRARSDRAFYSTRIKITLQMTELDEAWELALAEATQRARTSGRADIARYLDLRRRNDLLRSAATAWLHDAFVALAADANRAGAAIQIERHEDHRFKRGSATMVGRQLILKKGVRALTVESGWPRTPRDGVVRGNGLACANIKHRGKSRSNAELLLVSNSNGSPEWIVIEDDSRTPLRELTLRRHVSLLNDS